MANANTPLFIKLGTDLIVGAIIRNAGDATAQAAKAAVVIAVAAAMAQINSGDVNGGITALEAALSSSAVTDPAQATIIQTAITWLASKAAALQGLAGGTLLSSLNTDILNQVLAEATSLAQKYIPAAKAA